MGMTAMDVINRERIYLREFKAALIAFIEEEIGKQVNRLDSAELRISKEGLTGGKPTITMQDQPIDASEIIGSLEKKVKNGQPQAEADAAGPGQDQK